MRTISSIVLIFLVGGLMQSCGYQASHKASKQISQTAEHLTLAKLVVKTKNGSIDIKGDPSLASVEISAKITCGGSSQEEADRCVALATLSIVRDENRVLTIEPVFPDGRRNGDGASITVRLPDTDGIDARSSNGRIVVVGLGGELKADTSNGSVEVVDHFGSATLKSSNGRVTARNIAGDLDAHTSNARIVGENIRGSVTARTSNGRVTLILDENQTGPIDVKTSNASVAITVGPAFSGHVTFDTSNGSVKLSDPAGLIVAEDFDRRHRDGEIQVGSGDAKSRIDTSNASITFTISG